MVKSCRLMTSLCFETLQMRGGPFVPAAKRFINVFGATPIPQGRDGITQLARWIDDFGQEEIAYKLQIEDDSFIEGAGSLLGLLLIQRYDRAHHQLDDGTHLVQLNRDALFNPFFAVEEALDSDEPYRALANHLRSAEAEAQTVSHQRESQSWTDARLQLLPRLVGAAFLDALPEDLSLVNRPVAADIFLCFQLAEGKRRKYVHQSDATRWRVDHSILRATAIENLTLLNRVQRITKIQHDGVELMTLRSGDGLDASRMLLPELAIVLGYGAHADLVTGVPHRDVLVATTRSQPNSVDAMQGYISEEFARAPHGISEALFSVDPLGVRAFDQRPNGSKSLGLSGAEPIVVGAPAAATAKR